MKIKLFTYWEGYKPDYIKLCGGIIPCKLEGVSFSENAKKLGFNIYGCLKFQIKHCNC